MEIQCFFVHCDLFFVANKKKKKKEIGAKAIFNSIFLKLCRSLWLG